MFNPQGSLHGGILATAMDVSMGHLLRRIHGARTTLEMKIQYLGSVLGGLVRSFVSSGWPLDLLSSVRRANTGGGNSGACDLHLEASCQVVSRSGQLRGSRISRFPRFSPRYNPAIAPGQCSIPSSISSRYRI